MISRSMPTSLIRHNPSLQIGSPSTVPTAEQLLDTIHQLTEAADASGIRALLQAHPGAFAESSGGTWCITPACRLDLRALFDKLDPAISLPPIRLEGFDWNGENMCSSLLCHPGLQDLTLHECAVTTEAWAAVAEHGQQAFATHPSSIRRLACTFELPDRSALQKSDVASSAHMAQWTGQLHQLQDLTLSGFQHPYHMSYRHVFEALANHPLERLSLRGFMPNAFVSPSIRAAMLQISPQDGGPFCLSMQDWIWPDDTDEERDATDSAVLDQAEQTLQTWLASASSHLTVDLQSMNEAHRLSGLVGRTIAERTHDVSLRVDCPEDPTRQSQMPEHCNHAVLQALSDTATAIGASALVGLHMQLVDAEPLPPGIEPLLGVAQGLTHVTVALRHTGPANTNQARKTDLQLSGLLQALPSLTSLDIRSDHELIFLHDMKAFVETPHHDLV